MSLSLIWSYMTGGFIGLWKSLFNSEESNKETRWGYIGIVVGCMLIFYFFRRPILRMMNKVFGGAKKSYSSWRRKRRK